MLLPTVKPSMLPPTVCPLLVFVNGKSGGGQGLQLISSFRKLLNPHQVFDLCNGGPLCGWVKSFSIFKTSKESYPALVRELCTQFRNFRWPFRKSILFSNSILSFVSVRQKVKIIPYHMKAELCRSGFGISELFFKIVWSFSDDFWACDLLGQKRCYLMSIQRWWLKFSL